MGIVLLGWPLTAAASDAGAVLVGACPDVSLTIRFTPPRTTLPSSTNTGIDLDAEAPCLLEPDGAPTDTRTATFSADGIAGVSNALSCAAGTLTIPGWFDTDYPGFASVVGTYAITLAAPVAVVTFHGKDWPNDSAGVAAGVFLRSDNDPCPHANVSVEITTWDGSLAFAAKSEGVASGW